MPLQSVFLPLSRLAAALLCTTFLFAHPATAEEPSETTAAPAAASEPFELVILHANDTHAYAAGMTERGAPCDADEACLGGYARIAAKIKSEKAAHPHVLALDAGDRWQGTLFFRTGGEVFIGRATNAIPWDALTLGNHEFDLGVDVLAEHLKRSTHPTLAANIAPKAGSALDKLPRTVFAPDRLFEFDGVKVGVFGLANSEEDSFAARADEMAENLDFLENIEAARTAVARLETAGADIVIALTHQGYEADQALAEAVRGIDVIVGGHTHSLLGEGLPGNEGPYPTVVVSPEGERTLVVQAKRSTEYLGRLVVRFSHDGRAIDWSGAPVRLEKDLPRDPELESIVTEAAQDIAEFRAAYVSSNPNRYADGLDACREGECLSGLLAADAFLDFARKSGAQIALVNGGAIRSALPVGRIDRGSILEMHPFGNRLAVIEVAGRDIVAALEHGTAEPTVDGPHLLQPAGLRYEIDPTAPVGRRIVRVEVPVADESGTHWRAISPEKRYRVVTLDYLARGGDGFTFFARAKHLSCEPCEAERGALDLEIFAKHLEARDPVPMPSTGRITGFGPAAY